MNRSEAEAIEAELTPPFEVARPRALKAPFVFNSPHSGRVYPRAFLSASRLDALTLRRSEDAYVEELFAFVADMGAPLLYAHFPRAYLDVNREPYELDPALFRDGLPHYANTQSVRVVGGLGTIARIVSESDEIYREPLTVGAALERINRLYTPYHATLRALLLEAEAAFGLAVLIDCHSMPSSPMADQGGGRPDFVLGDRYGASCNAELPTWPPPSSRLWATPSPSTSPTPEATSPSIMAGRNRAATPSRSRSTAHFIWTRRPSSDRRDLTASSAISSGWRAPSPLGWPGLKCREPQPNSHQSGLGG